MSVIPSRTRRVALLGALGTLLAAGSALAGAAPAAAGEDTFGTAPVVAAPPAPETPVAITSVSTGRHAGFDRVVFRLSGPTLGYEVRYGTRLVEDPTGRPLPIAGSAVLGISMRQTDWIDRPSPRTNVTLGFPALKQVRFAGEFEAVVSYGIGQATKAGFRVFRLTGPDRIVVDVKHPPATGATRPAAPGAGTGTDAGTGTGAGTGTDAGTGASADGLAETDAAGDPMPVALVGGLLLLGGLAAAAVGVHVSRRNA
jgi:hypothetical protein